VVTTTGAGGGISSGDALVVAIIAVAVIAGIGLYVWADSRRSSRRLSGRGNDGTDADGGRHKGSKAPPKSRKPTAAERRRRKRGQAPRRKK
jgi:hypothetical protein